MHNKLNFLLILFSSLCISVLNANAQDNGPYVNTVAIPSTQNITAGQSFEVLIHQTIKEDWHIYWKNPGDTGAEPRFNFFMPEGFKQSDISWSTPQRLPIGDLMNFGYTNEAFFKTTFTAPKNLTGEKISLALEAEWLVCHDICIPESQSLDIELNIQPQNSQDTKPKIFRTAAIKFPTVQSWPSELYNNNDQLHIKLDPIASKALQNAKDITFFPAEWGLIQNNAPILVLNEEKGEKTLSTKSGERQAQDVQSFPIVINWIDTQTNLKHSIEIITTPKTTVKSSNVGDIQPLSEKPTISFLTAIALAFIGGLILNLMPCVFPVLSMKALSLVQLKDNEQGQALKNGIAYTVGVIISFIMIASLLIALKEGGEQIGWGFQLQSPIVITILAWLLFIIGLNLSGFFEISGRFMNIGQSLTQKKGSSGSFFTGVLATIVATPCTAPFMGTAMGYALTQPALISLTVFLSLGFGLAFPYLALCANPSLRHILPKPGEWMNTFKQFLAFPMYASAIWLTWVLEMQLGDNAIIISVGGMLAFTLMFWVISKNKNQHLFFKTIRFITILIIIMTLAKMISFTYLADKTNTEAIVTEQAYDKTTLNKFLAEDDPIFVNMTAAWCITCKINERIALKPKSTQRLLKKHKVKYLKGDWTNYDKNITEYLESYDRNGVPLYVYYGPRNKVTGNRPKPIILPQLLTPSIIKQHIEQ